MNLANRVATHECVFVGCHTMVSAHLAMCPKHWRMVPPPIQRRVYAAHREGNRQAWRQAIQEAQDCVAEALASQAEREAREHERRLGFAPDAPEQDLEYVPIYGRTYPVREELKKLGGRWDAGERCWMVPHGMKLRAQVLVENAPVEEVE